MSSLISALAHYYLTVGVFVIAVATAIILSLQYSADPNISISYRKKHPFFTPEQRAFLDALERAAGNRFKVMSKVSLADIVSIGRINNRGRWQTAYNELRRRCVDFVICDTSSLAIRSVVVLDGGRYLADPFWDRIFKAADIPVFHFSPALCPSPEQLEAVFCITPVSVAAVEEQLLCGREILQ